MLDALSLTARIGNRVLRWIATGIALLMFAFAGYSVLDSWYMENTAFSSWGLEAYKPVDESGNLSTDMFAELQKVNPDVVGWVTIYDTNIDYPIVQGPDDLYYVNRNVYGDSTLSGSIYLQAENNRKFTDSYNLLYGHHFENGAMFGDVSKFKDQQFMNEHKYGELITEDGIYYLNIFACLETSAYDTGIYGKTSISETGKYKLRSSIFRSAHNGVDEVDEQERVIDSRMIFLGHSKVLAMSTCDDSQTDGRDVVVADIVPGGPSRVTNTDAANVNGSSKIPATGEDRGGKWAVLNLLSLIFTVLCIVPFLYRLISGRDGETRLPDFTGTSLIILAAVGSALLFINTENMRTPITLRDQWTPYMILIFAAALLITALADRHRQKKTE